MNLDAALTPCGVERATEYARILLGSYPRHDVPDPDIYTRAIVACFADYGAPVCKQAVDELTRTLKWLPARAEVVAALERIASPLRARRAAEQRRLASPSHMASAEPLLNTKEGIERFKRNHNGMLPHEAWKKMVAGAASASTMTTAKGRNHGTRAGNQDQDQGGTGGRPGRHGKIRGSGEKGGSDQGGTGQGRIPHP